MPVSQNDEQVVNEFHNQRQSVPLYSEGIEMNNSAASCGSTELTFEQQLQEAYKPELSCEKQSINLKVIKSHTITE